MQDTPEFLVVVPSGQFVPTDTFLENRIYELLQADRPTRTIRALSAINDLVGVAAGPFGLLGTPLPGLTRWMGPKFTPRTLKGLAVEDVKPWLMDLLRAFYTTDPGTMLPDLWVLKPEDPRLAELHSVEDRFVHNTVYAGHPAEPTSFIRLADFHPYLLQEKRAEFVRLAAALGSKSIHLVDSLSTKRVVGVETSLKDDLQAGSLGAGVRVTKSAETSFNLSATFHPHSVVQLSIPENLLWLRHEPYWRSMAEVRIAHWAATYNVRFSYTQDFNVNANLAGILTGLGFSIGGSFSAFEQVEQEYIVEFFPPPS